MEIKGQIQRFGRSLSAMVMPNIGAFIAWGLITAIFIEGGWMPNEHIAKMVSPMLKYLLPLLIAFTAGKNVGGYRGGVAGAVAAMGVIIGTDTPMFLGAMIVGPIAGWCVKKFDKLVENKITAGFEMLIDNFSLGIIAMLLAIIGYLLIGHAVSWVTDALSRGVNWMLDHKMNPLLAVLVDPAKVLFLNNAVNHGIMTPLGIQQAAETGQSMLFLVDPNPGPGLGILLACWLFGKGSTRDSAPGAMVIQLFGGIHEIYFPYVLARPILLIPVMVGNICALSFFTLVNFGLVAPASPGSLISIILMSPRGKTLMGIAGVLIGAAVSCLLAWPIVKRRPDFQGKTDIEPSDNGTRPSVSVDTVPETGITKVVFSCDAGMGSSALGASRFKARLLKAGLKTVSCSNCAVGEIPADASVVVCQHELAERARKSGKPVIAIANFLKDPALDKLLLTLQTSVPAPQMLSAENVSLGLASESREDAIRRAGEMLVSGGYVTSEYVDAMLEREKIAPTYMGDGVAIPHGTSEAKRSVIHSGVVLLQYPQGVDFDGETAYLVVGIAGKEDRHLEILSKIAEVLGDQATLDRLRTTPEISEVLDILGTIS